MKIHWSTEVEVADDLIVVKFMVSMDPGPMREFRPFLDVPLDEGHASELLSKLSMALRSLRDRSSADEVLR